MQVPLFESEEAPEGLENFHFRIRSPVGLEDKDERGRSVYSQTLDTGILRIFQGSNEYANSPLVVKHWRRVKGEDVVYVQLRLSKTVEKYYTGTIDTAIAKLCVGMVNQKNRTILETLSTRSILGFSAVNEVTEAAWRKALFEAITHDGAEYLERIQVITRDQIPTWALAVSFLLMAGINIGGGYMAVKAMKNPTLVKNFLVGIGPAGVAAGGRFLINLLGSKAPDVEKLKETYDNVMEHLKNAIENVLEEIQAIQNIRSRSKNADAMADRCGQIARACYATAASAGRAMVANEDVCRAYVHLRNKAAMEMVNDCAAFLGSVTQGALAFGAIPAKMSSGHAALALVGLAKAPTTIIIANPLGLCAALAGMALTGYTAYTAHRRKLDMESKLREHRDIIILISTAWGTSDDIARYVELMHCLAPKTVNINFLRALGDEDGARRFEEFMGWTREGSHEHDKDKTTKTKKKTEGKSQRKRMEKPKAVQVPHIIRFIKQFTKAQAEVLSNTLWQLERDGTLGLPQPDPSPPYSFLRDSDTEASDTDAADNEED